MNTKRYFSVQLILLLFAFVSLNAQQRLFTPQTLFELRSAVEVAVSPDGKYIAYVLNVPRRLNEELGADYRELHVYNLVTGKSKPYVAGEKIVSAAAWTPDSKKITFKANLGDVKTTQVYMIDVDGGSPVAVTSAASAIDNYRLSPDGKKLAYTSTEPQPVKKSNLLKKGFDAEIYEEEYSNLNLYIYDLEKEVTNKLTSNVTVFDFKWSPNGKYIAAQIAPRNLVDDSYMFKRIYLIDPNNGVMTKLVDNPGKLSEMEWSPDSRHLAFVAASDINDAVSGSLFVTEVSNSKKFEELRNYSKGFAGSVVNVSWKDNETLLFSAEEGVDVTLSEQKLNDDVRKLLINPGEVFFGGFSYAGGVVAFAGDTPKHPSELYLFSIKSNELKKLTDNNSFLSEFRLGKQEKISYQAKDGLTIEGILIYPVNYEEGKRYPLITYIHGGPEACEQNGWNTSYGKWGQIAASRDYFVFIPNYRASAGRGVEFTKMGFGDLAGAEFTDVLDGIDYLIGKGFADKNKVGIGGGSYGGYFSMWAATKHTDRFAASVAFVGVSNQISKRNTTDIPYEDYYVHWGIWTHENFELVWDRSPVKWAHQSKTPMLILHGKEDPRVHPSQSLEMYRTLKTHGKAPVRLVWYPGEGHGNRKNTSKYDFAVRTMEWFDYYLKSDKPKDQMPDKYLEFGD